MVYTESMLCLFIGALSLFPSNRWTALLFRSYVFSFHIFFEGIQHCSAYSGSFLKQDWHSRKTQHTQCSVPTWAPCEVCNL